MAPPALDRLPPEMLGRICEHLNEADPWSVVSFALASKHCRWAAGPVLFRKLSFKITTPESLFAYTRACTDLLRRNHAFGHVRCVVLTKGEGFMMDDDYDEDKADEELEALELMEHTLPLPLGPWHPGFGRATDWCDINLERMRSGSNDSALTWRNWADQDPEVDFDDFPFDIQEHDTQ